MKYVLNKKFSLDSDRLNWILLEQVVSKSGKQYVRYSYFPTLKLLSKSLIDRVAKDSRIDKRYSVDKKQPTIKRINLLMGQIAKDLELFLKEVTNNVRA